MAFSERFDSNWDLSAARAAAVADYFMASAPINSDRINVLGFADTKTSCLQRHVRRQIPE